MFVAITTGLLSMWLAAAGQTLTGKVVAVHDGDTLSVLSESSLYKVRLSDVDAPEMGQMFGRQARQFAKDRVLGRRVWVNVAMIDRHGRRVGEVVLEDGGVLNEELVHAGLAWYYRVHPVRNERLQRLEQYAFANKLGLWVEKDRVPPWEFRREATIPEAPETPSEADYDRIFHYGILGDRNDRTFRWPACKHYQRAYRKAPAVFNSLQQARQMGYRPAKDCPR